MVLWIKRPSGKYDIELRRPLQTPQHNLRLGAALLSFKTSVRTVLSNRNLLAVTLAQSISMFATFLWRPFWGLYILELGGSKSVLGALSTLGSFSRLLLQLPGGMLADSTPIHGSAQGQETPDVHLSFGVLYV